MNAIRSMLRWAIGNTPAMNMLMLSIVALGLLSGNLLRREDFPRFELEVILVTVPYPGASPDEVETGICQKIEEAVRSIDGIKKLTSIAAESSGSIVLELHSDVPEVQRVLNEVESEIDRISSFPALAEEPEIQQLTIRNSTIKVGVVAAGNQAADAELQLREVTEQVRDDLLAIPEITVANIQGERDYQIDVEISETALRKYGLTLRGVAEKLRQQNLELPAGTIKNPAQEFLLRGKNKRVIGSEISKIPLVTDRSSVVLTVDDLGTVRDGFADTTSISSINGHPGMAISIEAAAREDMLAMTEAVHHYVAAKQMPVGYELAVWDDRSIDVRERLELLIRNGLQGLILVFLTLALFLELRLAFWVAIGIPVSILGACAVLWQFDQTLNMLSMFAFLIALGIVVDDAIVIGENIYSHREQGKDFVRAAIDGTAEVLPSVFTSITSTVFAFVPMFFVTGVMGKFFAVLPVAVIAMLVISLVESTLVLPCHLAHEHSAQSWTARARRWRAERRTPPARWLVGPLLVSISWLADRAIYPWNRLAVVFHWVNARFSKFLDRVIQKLYRPALAWAIGNPAITCSIAVGIFLLSISLLRNGTVPWTIFPKLDTRSIQAQIVYPDGTPSAITDRATKRLEAAIQAIGQQYAEQGQPVLRLTHRIVGQVSSQSPGGPSDRTTGGHSGAVRVELVNNQERSVTSQELADQWRAAAGAFAGVESLSFGTIGHGPGGTPIEFKLLANPDAMPELEAAVEATKAKLATYPGVYDIRDDSSPGKWEIQVRVKENARMLGVPLEAIAGTVRAAYHGEEVMRLQRGRHEVKLMVRHPAEDRRSLADFNNLRVDTGDGVKRPIHELADIQLVRGYSEINRLDQRRAITITADVDENRANAAEIVGDLKANFMPELFANSPDLRIRWEGQQEQSRESLQSLMLGLAVALLATFALLTLEFKSYLQPAIVMAVIPFGMIGAIWGHAAMGIPLTMFSMLGMVALTGVVVNDSIVLVDFINTRLRAGVPLREALLESGQRRFRPVVLTSLTTVAGLLPILTEQSLQAQILIPMANSLCFGLMFATWLVLFLVPTLYLLYAHAFGTAEHAMDEPDETLRSTLSLPSATTGHDDQPELAPEYKDAVEG